MPKFKLSPTLQRIAQDTASLSRDELLELQAIVQGLLESLDEPDEADEPSPSEPKITADNYRGKRGGRGYREIKSIPDKKSGKTYGPYLYLRYWQGKKLKSVYLGKAEGLSVAAPEPSADCSSSSVSVVSII